MPSFGDHGHLVLISEIVQMRSSMRRKRVNMRRCLAVCLLISCVATLSTRVMHGTSELYKFVPSQLNKLFPKLSSSSALCTFQCLHTIAIPTSFYLRHPARLCMSIVHTNTNESLLIYKCRRVEHTPLSKISAIYT